MSADRNEIVRAILNISKAAGEAGLLETARPTAANGTTDGDDPWASLDDVWDGPDVDLDGISILGQDALTAIHKAHAEGRASHGLIAQAIELARLILPGILT